MNKQNFLKELEGRGFNFQDKSYTEFGFNDEILNMVYEMYCAGLEAKEDLELNAIADSRAGQKGIKITLDEL